MITLDIRGLSEVQRMLRNLAEEQMPFALSSALNSTAFAVQKESRQRIATAFDRPTPFIQSATRVEKSTKQSLTATVFIEPKRAQVLQWHEFGGARGRQRIETWLQGKGWLPQGWRAIPGNEMPRNSYGNPKQGVITQIIAALGQGLSGKAGTRRFFCIPVGSRSHLYPGIYRVQGRSLRIALLYLFVSQARYQAELKWRETVEASARRLLPGAMNAAIRRAIETAR